MAKGYLDRLTPLKNRSYADQWFIGRAVLRYGTKAGNLNMLLAAANEPRYDHYARAAAWRQAVRILAGRKDTARAIAEMRKLVLALADRHNYTNHENYYRSRTDPFSNYEVWRQIREAFGGNRQAAYDALKKIEDDDNLWWSGRGLRELLRHELGKLAYSLGKKDAARRYFARINVNDDMAADCWLAYFELAYKANDLEAMLLLGIAADPSKNYNVWPREIRNNRVPKQLEPALKKLLEEGKFPADEKAYFDILAAQLARAKAPELVKQCDGFLAKFAQSKRVGDVALRRARIVRSTLKKQDKQLETLADWLVAAAPKIKNTDQRAQALTLAGDLYGECMIAPAGTRIKHWSIVGPFDATDGKGFDKAFGPEPNPNVTAAYPAMKMDIAVADIGKIEQPKEIKWVVHDADKNGYVNLDKRMNPKENVAAYAAAFVSSPVAQDVLLYATSQKPIKVFVNGKAVVTVKENTIGYEPDSYMAIVKLVKGNNSVLVKTVQSKGSWGFSVRMSRLTAPSACSTAPGGGKRHDLAAAPKAELKMWAAYANAEKITKGAEKTANTFRPFERLWDWARGTEARGGYRSLLALDEAQARIKLAESYSPRHPHTKYPLRSSARFSRELAPYVKKFAPENRRRVRQLIESADLPRLEEAVAAAEAYLAKHPGNWDLAYRMWKRTNDHRRWPLGIKHAVNTVQAYPEYRDALDRAVGINVKYSPELTKIRYDRTKNNNHLLEWTNALYNVDGRQYRRQADAHKSTAGKSTSEADKHDEDFRRDTEYARQKTEQAKSFDNKAAKAKADKKDEDAKQFANEANKLRAEVKKHQAAAKKHQADAKAMRTKADAELAESKKNYAEFERIRSLWVQRFSQAVRGKLAGVRPSTMHLRLMCDIDRAAAAKLMVALGDTSNWSADYHSWYDIGRQFEYGKFWSAAAASRNAVHHSYSQNHYIDEFFRWSTREVRAGNREGAVRPLKVVMRRFPHLGPRAIQAQSALCNLYLPTGKKGSLADYVAEVHRFLVRHPGTEAAQKELDQLRHVAERAGDVASLIENISEQIEKTRDEEIRHALSITKAQLLYGTNRYYEALKVLKPYPTADTASELLKAACMWKILDYGAARKHLARARANADYGKDSTKTPSIEFLLAMVQFSASDEDYEEAYAYLDEAVQLYQQTITPEQTTRLRIARIDVLIAEGNLDTAFPLIKQVMAENVRRSAYWIGEIQLGKMDYFRERYAECLKRFERVAKLYDPVTSPRALFWIGKTKLALEKPDEAIETFKELWERYGGDDLIIQAIYLIGQTFRKRGEFADAIRLFESVGVMRAAAKDKIVPGEDVLLKIVDPDYAVGTGRDYMDIDVETTGGDAEKVRVDMNPINRALYVGSIKSKLGSPRPNSGFLELRGNDVITVRYLDLYGKMTIEYGKGSQIDAGTAAVRGIQGTDLAQDIGSELFGNGNISHLERATDKGLESAMGGYIDGGAHKSYDVGVRFLRPRLVNKVRIFITGTSHPKNFEVQVLKRDGDEKNPDDWLVRGKVEGLEGKGWQDIDFPLSDTKAVRVFVPDHPDNRSWKYINEIQVIEGSTAQDWHTVNVKVEGSKVKLFKLYVVDTGELEISSVRFKDEKEKEGPGSWRPLGPGDDEEEEEEVNPLEVTVARRRQGQITPGNTAFVRLKDKDFDISDEREKVTVTAYALGEALAGERVRMDSCVIELEEVGPNVGEFWGLIQTRPSAPTVSASDTAVGFSADFAINNNASPQSAWQAQIDGLPGKWIEVDLKDVFEIAEVQWSRGTGAEDRVINDGSITIASADDFREITFEGNQKANGNVMKIDPPARGRYVRLTANFYDGDAPAIAQIIIKDAKGKQLVPTEITPEVMRTNNVLELNVGDSIQVEYIDEENVDPGKPTKRVSNSLSVQYYNAGVTMAIAKLDKFGRVTQARRTALINSGDLFQVMIHDVDEDKNDEEQSVRVFIGSESGDSMEVTAKETRGDSGTFSVDVKTSPKPEAKKDPRRLYVREGDAVWATYMDNKNMVPGHKTIRSAMIFESTPTSGSVVPPKSYIAPVPDFMGVMAAGIRAAVAPRAGIEVVDPDAAVSPYARVPMFMGANNRGDRRIVFGGARNLQGGIAASVSMTKMEDAEPYWAQHNLAFDELIFTPEEVEDWVRTLEEAGEQKRRELASGSALPVLGDDVIFSQYVDKIGATSDLLHTRVLTRVAFRAEMARNKGEVPPPDSKEFLAFSPMLELADPETLIEEEEAERERTYKRLMANRHAMYEKMLAFQVRRKDYLLARLDEARAQEQKELEGPDKEKEKGAAPQEKPQGANGQENEEKKPATDKELPDGFMGLEGSSAVGTRGELAVLTAVEIFDERLRKAEQDVEATRALVDRYSPFALPEDQRLAPEPDEPVEIKREAGVRYEPYFQAPAPGYPFRIWITDRDLTRQGKCKVVVRSYSHGYVGRLEVEAVFTEVEEMETKEKRQVLQAIVPTAPVPPGGKLETEGVLPMVWGSAIRITYEDNLQQVPENKLRHSYLAFASSGVLRITQKNFVDPPESLRVGETLHVAVADLDRDVTYERDSLLVEATSELGDSLVVMLDETAPRSGEFRGRIQTAPGNANPSDGVLQTTYGGKITVQYKDYIYLEETDTLRARVPRPGEEEEEPIKTCVELSIDRDERGIRVATAVATLLPGSDGGVMLFARNLKRGRLEKETLFSTGYCNYMLGRSFSDLGAVTRSEEAFARARDDFELLIRRYTDHKEVAHATFYLGNIELVRKNYREAIAYYRSVIDNWPNNQFVAETRLRMGMAYEQLAKTQEAIDQYAYLAFHHKDSPYVRDAMVNMVEHFDKLGQRADKGPVKDIEARNLAYSRLVSVARRFVQKFPDDPRAPKLILRAGLRMVSLEHYVEAAELLEEAELAHPKSRYMPAFLYWHSVALSKGGGELDRAKLLLQRVMYDFDNERYARAARALLSVLNKKQ